MEMPNFLADMNRGNPQNGTVQNAATLPATLLSMPGLQSEESMDLPRLLALVRQRAGVIVGVAAAVVAATAFHTFSQEPIYQSKFQMLVEPVNADDNLSDLTQALGTLDIAKAGGKSSGLDYETQIQVLRSPALMEEVLKQLQKTYPDIEYEELIKNLTIARPKETKILEVSYQDPDPAKIQTVLDTLSQSYLRYSLLERQTNLRQGIQFIDQQLPELRRKVDSLQSDLERFRQTYNFIDPESLSQQLTAQKTAIGDKKQELQQKLAYSGAYYNKLQDETGGVAALKDAPVYQDLVKQLREIEVQIAAESTRFKPSNINIRLLEQKRQNLLPIIRQEARRVVGTKLAEAASELTLLQSQSQSLQGAEAQLQQNTQDVAALTRRYADLQRELQIAQGALNRFLENRQALQVQAAQTEIPWQVIEVPIMAEEPISPNKPRALILGTVAGVLCGLGVAMLLEKLHRSYRTIDDIKRDVKLPILGQLPLARELTDEQPQTSLAQLADSFRRLWPSGGLFPAASYGGYYGYGGASSFLEAMRILYTNLQLLSSDRPIRSITISSSMPGDGKSTVSTYLAQTAVAMGKRVLLIDADLRRPQVHNRLNLSNQQGLSDLLTSEITSETVLASLQRVPGLTVLTAGTIPPDATRLLSSLKMRQLMQIFESSYDLVIYDMPPLLGLADPTLLAPHTDGLVLVTRIEQTDREALKQAVETLNQAKIPTLGLVVNGVPRGSTSAYTYYKYQSQAQKDLFSYVPAEASEGSSVG
jgi:capsular exopolysaccharide synthesis family protein